MVNYNGPINLSSCARIVLGTFYINIKPTQRNLLRMLKMCLIISGWYVAIFDFKPTLHRNLVVDC